MVPQANLNPRFSSGANIINCSMRNGGKSLVSFPKVLRFKKLQNSVNLAEPVQTDLNISLRVPELQKICPHFSLKNRVSGQTCRM
jgi:hypothetical protein